MKTKNFLGLKQLVAPLSLTATIALSFCSQASAITLGYADGYNVFVFGNMTQTSDSQGRVAVGGNAILTSFATADRLARSNVPANPLIVGGNLVYTNGQVFGGNAVYGGTATLTNVGIPDGQFIQGNPVDFAAAQQELTGLSSALGQLNANGTTRVEAWRGIYLTGQDANLNVFTLNGSDLSAARFFEVNAPAGSTVVVNVTGQTITLSNFGMQINGTDKQNVLYNFVNATSLSSDGFTFQGSVLAPLAQYNFNNGNIEGTLIAASVSGNGEFHNYLFAGNLPNLPVSDPQPPTASTSVPEPTTLAGLGLVAATGVVLRRKGKQKVAN